MTAPEVTLPHAVAAVDEGTHAPGPERLWSESVYADFAADDGSFGGYMRVGMYPNLGLSWWHAFFCGPGLPTTVVSSFDAPLPATGFGPAYSVSEPLAQARFAYTDPGTSYDDPHDIYHGRPGRPSEVSVDLEFTTDGTPYAYVGTTRYEIPVNVAGSVEIDGRRVSVSCTGQRDHSYGVRDWWDFGWCWASARLSDGTRVHTTHVRLPGMELPFGYLQVPGQPVETVERLSITEELGEDSFPTQARIEAQDLGLTVVPIAFGPLLLQSPEGRIARFPRAMARYTADDGRTGLGWIEWNQVQPAS